VPEFPSRVILDPSFLFTEEALGWMETPGLGEYLVVSESLLRRFEDPAQLAEELAAHSLLAPNADFIEAIGRALDQNAITTFSYEAARESGELPPGTEEVCRALLDSGEPLADVLADEWAFVTSQSLAVLVERAGDALGAFTRAGATVVGVVKDQMKAALDAVQEQIPPGLLTAMKRVDDTWGGVPKFPKFLLAGGSFAAGLVLPPLGIGMGAAGLLVEGNGVLAGDP
jgi:hypothetical protein